MLHRRLDFVNVERQAFLRTYTPFQAKMEKIAESATDQYGINDKGCCLTE
jgi:hypothetical protein